MSGTNYTGHV